MVSVDLEDCFVTGDARTLADNCSNCTNLK